MPRRPTKTRRLQQSECPEDIRAYFEIGAPCQAELFFSDEEMREVWHRWREQILSGWIKSHPGTRPFAWWRWDAPRWGRKFGAFWDGKLPEPRRRIGGIGDPAFEHFNVVPRFEFGLPVDWVTDWQVAYYNGRARDIHGNPIGTQYNEGHFGGTAYDPNNPPTFETESDYLERYGLLGQGEKCLKNS